MKNSWKKMSFNCKYITGAYTVRERRCFRNASTEQDENL